MALQPDSLIDVDVLPVLLDSQDVQKARLVIDVGDDKTMTIEITLRGKLNMQSMGPQAAAAGAAPPVPTEGNDMLSEKAAEDLEFLDQMRGYLMAVATLFVGIAFQAATQPPSWMPEDWYQVYMRGPPPVAAPDTISRRQALDLAVAGGADTTKYVHAVQAFNYTVGNTLAFAVSLALVLVLLVMKRSTPTRLLKTVTVMVVLLCITVAANFIVGSTCDPESVWLSGTILFLYGLGTFFSLSWRFRAQDPATPA